MLEQFAAVDVIKAKRDGHTLTDAQIDWVIDAYTRGVVADEQMSALAMSILLNGMTEAEIVRWTSAMVNSGERMDFSRLSRPTVDKHSTGGVGDKITLPLVPVVAACGAAVGLGQAAPAVECARQPCGQLRVEGVDLQHAQAPELVAGRVLAVKGRRVAAAVAEQQAACAVRVLQVEVGVRHQLAHQRQHMAVAVGRTGLQCEPFVEYQLVTLEHGVETLQCLAGQRVAAGDQGAQRMEPVGHVAGLLEALERAGRPCVGAAAQAGHGQGHAGQRTLATGDRVGAVGAGVGVVVEGLLPVVKECGGQLQAHRFAHGMDLLRVDHVELLGDIGLGWQAQRQFLERGIQRRMAQNATHRLQEGRREHRANRCVGRLGQRRQCAAQRQALAGFPAVERVAVVGQQVQQLRVAVVEAQQHRRAEAAQDRRHGFGRQVDEGQRLFLLAQHEGARPVAGHRFVGQLQRHVAPVGAYQAEVDRDDEGLLGRLAGGRLAALRQRQRIAACGGVKGAARRHHGRAGLAVPVLELRQQRGQVGARVGIGLGLREERTQPAQGGR